MRVDDDTRRADERSKASFQEALKKAQVHKPLPKKAAVIAQPAQLLKPAPKLEALPKSPVLPGAKANASFAKLLVERRGVAEVHRPEIKRVAEKIAAILIHAPQVQAPEQPKRIDAPAASTAPTTAAPRAENAPQSPAPPRADALAGQIEKLIEHAELLSRAQGPALQLGLTEGKASQIEVVRTAKGEVSLRLEARSGSDRRALAAQAGKIRSALAERGVHVREMVIG